MRISVMGKPKSGPGAAQVLSVTPSRKGSRTVLGEENMVASLRGPVSLDAVGDADGVGLQVRCPERSLVKQQLQAHYPQALIEEVAPEDDPLRLKEGEQAWSMRLRIDGPEFVPLRTFRDDDLLDAGSDPLIALVGSMSGLERGERVVASLGLRSLGPNWADAHRMRLAREEAASRGPAPSSPGPGQVRGGTEGVGLAVLGVMALIGLRMYTWMQSGQTWKAVLLALALLFALGLVGWLVARYKRGRTVGAMHDREQIREKLSRVAFEAHLEVTVVLDEHGDEERAVELLEGVARAYCHYDNAAGARFMVGEVREVEPSLEAGPPPRGLFGRRDVLGVREVAALWHPPGEVDEMPLVERSGARMLLPRGRDEQAGALVGHALSGGRRPVYLGRDLTHCHHVYIARTGMGKSTLTGHVVAHRMAEKAAGRDEDAIVVIDPHADLVRGLLGRVPAGIEDRVRLIDLGDRSRSPGINLLDTRVFPDRDRTADAVVRIVHGLWAQWGPRMQSILEHTAKSLYEANRARAASEQYTILDGLQMLVDDDFRKEVLAKVRDPYLRNWWNRELRGWRHETRSDALAPVQTRLSYYASSVRARAILGQRTSTLDLRRTIMEGGVLLVSTAQGEVGREVSALVGGSLLYLVDAVVREQGSLPPEQRRGVLVVVDEMQSMVGVDYESMLSELGKFGGSFMLATQSLSKLDELSPTLQETLLANVGCLAVFQASSADARRLVGELNRDRVSEEDIVSLQAHQCYMRTTSGGKRQPAFSVHVLGPEPGDPDVAARIRAGTSAYTTSMEQIAEWESEIEVVDADAPRPNAGSGKKKAGSGKKKNEKGASTVEEKKPRSKNQQESKRTTGEPDESE